MSLINILNFVIKNGARAIAVVAPHI